jgi:Zn ribbon nucleic-acid-binding protein
MSAFNTVEISGTCPSCKKEVNLDVQFKYGDAGQHRYKLGDVITWGGNDVGRPGRSRVIVEGFAVCPACDSELDYEVWLESDNIVAVKPATGTYDLASTPDGYIVIEE